MNKWAEVSVHTTQEAVEAVANLLHEAGAGGVVIEDAQDLHRTVWHHHASDEEYLVELDPQDYPEEGVVVKAYFPVNSHLVETVDEIKLSLSNLRNLDIDLGRGTVTLTEMNEEDWAHAWKKYYKPVRISERITITPTWEAYTPQSENELVIKLDPGMAFGTGTHPTTMLCIRALERYVRPHDQVIDVGCGSGVLSIAAAKLGAGNVLALDIDELSVRVSKENVELNKVDKQVTVKQNNLLDNISQSSDMIVSNILAEVIVKCADQAYRLLKSRGFFIASGIIAVKEKMVKEALISQGFTIVETDNMDDWVAIVAQKV
jgi:ribosomal protein L11 methyltransferase